MAEGLTISTSIVTMWLPWLLLAAVVQMCLACLMQPRYLHGLVSNCLQPFSQNAAEQLPSIGAQIAQWSLNIALIVTCAYTYNYERGTETSFLWIAAAAVIIDVVRLAAAMTVTYTFALQRMLKEAYLRYFSLRSLYTLLLMVPILLLYNGRWVESAQAGIVILTAVYYVLLGVQLARLYSKSVLDILFVVIYLMTVEVIPTWFLIEQPIQITI